VRVAEIGQIHPGADDNASGVAVLLELARTLAAAGAPERTILFVAFSGKRRGYRVRSGSWRIRAAYCAEGIRAVVNLDTVGRLGRGELSVLGTGTASEWQARVSGITFSPASPLKISPLADSLRTNKDFIEHGIPGVQLFTAAHLDYHRPTDTADRIDFDGLIKSAATVAREAIEPSRASVLRHSTITIEQSVVDPPAPPPSGMQRRRSCSGLVPDYAHRGVGVRAEPVVPGSPAARAWYRSGRSRAQSARRVSRSQVLGAFLGGTQAATVRGDRIVTRVRRG
jgi:hypothetical protein